MQKPSNNQLNRELEKLRQENEELKRQLEESRAVPANFKKPKKLSEEDVKKIMEYHTNGQSNRKIAEEFGISEGTVRNYLKNNNQAL